MELVATPAGAVAAEGAVREVGVGRRGGAVHAAAAAQARLLFGRRRRRRAHARTQEAPPHAP